MSVNVQSVETFLCNKIVYLVASEKLFTSLETAAVALLIFQLAMCILLGHPTLLRRPHILLSCYLLLSFFFIGSTLAYCPAPAKSISHVDTYTVG